MSGGNDEAEAMSSQKPTSIARQKAKQLVPSAQDVA